ncbi:PREDICTED: KH domain-containing protein At4g18375 [Camelina sativa]|uniref:KH domain-containing protein At4g18375 n=1 Tax=Camelina sativa TaxID=90675 RepID=A0ABM0VBA6_CAMSA|nr:PREDICTED: KH domain-containing protein At4g18375 [Camelina sativa]XP_010453659.1 PREDICTED: KH domain-containing protein At4g18375 [Camelina sativa]XP_010453660.1 PREDICTED: KH domain-containing protein At4g18375 [Camelina sativa]XP_010453661.1 PREDICTED: KH domain-containing protein At4g18375 [Camelina sativa]
MSPDHRDSHRKRSRPQSDYDENGGNKRRYRGDDRDSLVIDRDDTVFRYLCPVKKIGSVIGRGGDIVKQLRTETRSKIRIGEAIPGCDERVITIYSPSDETNAFGDGGKVLSPAQDALFRIHDRVVADDAQSEDSSEGEHQVTAKLLVPSDQIGCILGRGGQIVQNIRSETGAQIRIIKDRNMPLCALSSDELIQISGEGLIVKKALHQIASRLHENPSRSQNLLSSAMSGGHPPASLMSHAGGPRLVGIAPLMGSYGRDAGEWSRPLYQPPRNEPPATEFYIRLVSPVENIASVIGKGGALINQLRQETRATIKVDSSRTEGNDCLITISAREVFEDAYSPTIEAAMRLQPKCSDKVERDSGLVSFTTRLLVPSSRIGCILGKGGAIITEMRRMTKANIRVLGKENLPKVASDDDEMVQISGDLDVAKDALIQITSRLRANVFDRESAVSALMPVLPYVPVAPDAGDRLDYDSRDSRRLERGNPYPGGYGSSALSSESYSPYGPPVGGSSSTPYGVYGGGYASERSGSSGLSSHSSTYRRRNYDY